MSRKICRIVLLGFGTLYVFALAMFAIGAFGLFGQPTDPLSGIYLVPLGLPWTLMLDLLPGPAQLWGLLAAPAINLAFFTVICRRAAARKTAARNDG